MADVTLTALDALAEKVEQREALSNDDAVLILESPDLVAIGMVSDQLRRQLHGADTTFVRVFETHVDAPPPALPAGTTAGEFRIVGTPASLDSACGAVRIVRRLAGDTPLFGFALHEIDALSGDPHEAFRRLKEAGLDGIAEVAVDLTTSVLGIAAARNAGMLV